MENKLKKLLILILLAVVLSGCGSTPSGGGMNEKLIYAAIDDEGWNTGTLVITDVNGRKMGEINLVEPEGRVYINLVPTRAPGIVLALQNSPDMDPQSFWVNTLTGEVKRLDLPDLPRVNSFFKSYSARFFVLEMGNPVEGIQAQLIDLQTGSLVDLKLLLKGDEKIRGGYFSTDESFLLISTDKSLWLLPTGDPDSLHLITENLNQFMFGPGGDQVIYSERIDDTTTIKTYTMSTKGTKNIYDTTYRLLMPGITTQNSDEIIVVQKGSVNTLNIQTGEFQTVFEKEDFVADRILKSVSEKSILALNTFDREYFLINLDTLDSQSLDELVGLEFWSKNLNLSVGSVQDWTYFVDSFVNPGTKVMKAINLDTGKVIDSLALKGDVEINNWVFATNFPSEGSAAFLVNGMTNNNEMSAWAINSDAELTVPLQGPDRAMFSLGGISQDGRWGVYSVNGAKDDKSVVLIDKKTGKTREIAPGTSPVWLVN